MTGQGNFACLAFLYHFPAISVVVFIHLYYMLAKRRGRKGERMQIRTERRTGWDSKVQGTSRVHKEKGEDATRVVSQKVFDHIQVLPVPLGTFEYSVFT